jgi:arsenate reductase
MIVKALGGPASDLLRRKDRAYRDITIDESDDAAVIAAMAEHPSLIERPVVIKGTRAVIGRPTEQIHNLL